MENALGLFNPHAITTTLIGGNDPHYVSQVLYNMGRKSMATIPYFQLGRHVPQEVSRMLADDAQVRTGGGTFVITQRPAYQGTTGAEIDVVPDGRQDNGRVSIIPEYYTKTFPLAEFTYSVPFFMNNNTSQFYGYQNTAIRGSLFDVVTNYQTAFYGDLMEYITDCFVDAMQVVYDVPDNTHKETQPYGSFYCPDPTNQDMVNKTIKMAAGTFTRMMVEANKSLSPSGDNAADNVLHTIVPSSFLSAAAKDSTQFLTETNEKLLGFDGKYGGQDLKDFRFTISKYSMSDYHYPFNSISAPDTLIGYVRPVRDNKGTLVGGYSKGSGLWWIEFDNFNKCYWVAIGTASADVWDPKSLMYMGDSFKLAVRGLWHRSDEMPQNDMWTLVLGKPIDYDEAVINNTTPKYRYRAGDKTTKWIKPVVGNDNVKKYVPGLQSANTFIAKVSGEFRWPAFYQDADGKLHPAVNEGKPNIIFPNGKYIVSTDYQQANLPSSDPWKMGEMRKILFNSRDGKAVNIQIPLITSANVNDWMFTYDPGHIYYVGTPYRFMRQDATVADIMAGTNRAYQARELDYYNGMSQTPFALGNWNTRNGSELIVRTCMTCAIPNKKNVIVGHRVNPYDAADAAMVFFDFNVTEPDPVTPDPDPVTPRRRTASKAIQSYTSDSERLSALSTDGNYINNGIN